MYFQLAILTVAVAASTVPVTPHASYSSSVGVLGCKVDTNRIAYWPAAVSCSSICVSLSYGGRTLYLLRVDQSGGAHDVSYDAWNYLVTGKSATEAPAAGGAVDMETADVDVSLCADLLHTTADGSVALPLSASNSMNYVSSCLEAQQAGNDSWVAGHYALFNILDALCTYGYDEPCTIDDWPDQNQPACGHTLGLAASLDDATPVYNIEYPTGNTVLASTGETVAYSNASTSTISSSSSGKSGGPGSPAVGWPALGVSALLLVGSLS